MTQGPTKGAKHVARRDWHASPALANLIRLTAFVTPFIVAWLAIRLAAGSLYRPAGRAGLAVWVVQAATVGLIVSKSVERVTRHLLPLASLFSMSMIFPDQAPSRFSIALRSSTIKQLRKRVDDVATNGLGQSESEAATTAVGLVHALGAHDRLTRGHTERVRAYAGMIAEELELSEADQAKLAWGAMLHDIGKITVDPAVLNKRGRPNEAEWDQLKQHPARSVEFLTPLEPWLGDWLLAASEHHERWDGTGYPLGLRGEEISLAGRITAVADAYDVITSKRSYKDPMSADAARQELVRCAGSQFDPMVVRAFLNISLGRQWSSGPLAWVTELPGLQVGASAVASTTPIAAATSMTAVGSAALILSATVASAPPDTLAMIDASPATTTSASESSTTTPRLVEPVPTTQPATSTTEPGEEATLPSTTLPLIPDPLTPTTDQRPLVPTSSVLPTTLPPTTLPPTTLLPTTTTRPATTTTLPPSTTTTTWFWSNIVNDDTVTAREGKNTKIYVFANDNWLTILTWDFSTLAITQAPSHGEIDSFHNDHYHYKADKDYEGQDSFVYQICNYQDECDSATVSITVTD